MFGDNTHLSDDELLLFSDQELRTQDAARAREHVGQCEHCRTRLTCLESASADFLIFHEREIRAQSSAWLQSKNLLKARLSEASQTARRPRPLTLGRALVRQLAGASVALLLVAGTTWTVGHFVHARSKVVSMKVFDSEAIALPRRALTPGSARAVRVAELCSRQDLDNDPPVDISLEQAVFSEYGVPASSKKDYQLDYLITPALGGVDNIRNLWPEPYSVTWNSRVKDQLENHLHNLVCQGKVQLTTAQNDIASDWIAAYKRYFNTDAPQPGMPTTAGVDSTQELSKIGSPPAPITALSLRLYPGPGSMFVRSRARRRVS